MNRKQKAEKTKKTKKHRADLRRKKDIEKARVQELTGEEDDELFEEATPSPEPIGDVEDVQKDYMGEMPVMMEWGPLSFDELDAQEVALERAEAVREVTYQTQDLVWNILHSPSMDEKAKAGKIMDVAKAFESRVGAVMAEDMQKDMTVLEIEAILAVEERSRNRNLIKKGAEDLIEFSKKMLSGKARKALSDADFALPEKRKYPIHDKAHVRNALARAAQQISVGGEAAADAKKAMPKIRAAAKKFGIEVTEKSIHIEKDAKGDWRWIGRPATNFIDWQVDIMSKAAHQKYVNWLDANPDMAPVFMSWHTPGTARENPVDFWAEHEGALLMSGKLTETEARHLLSMQKQIDLGMSVQGLGLRLNKDDSREITDYWLFEVSDLPLDSAANPFTSLETITKEVGMDKLKYLSEMMGSEERAKAYLEKTGQMQKELQAAGITSKAKEEATTPETTESKAPAAVTDTETLKAELLKALGEELDIEGLNAFVAQAQEAMDKVTLLEGMIKEMQVSDDEKLAQALTPPVVRFNWSRQNRASESSDTVLKKSQKQAEDDDDGDEDEILSKAKPVAHWLSEVTNTVPIPAEMEA